MIWRGGGGHDEGEGGGDMRINTLVVYNLFIENQFCLARGKLVSGESTQHNDRNNENNENSENKDWGFVL